LQHLSQTMVSCVLSQAIFVKHYKRLLPSIKRVGNLAIRPNSLLAFLLSKSADRDVV